MSGQLHPEVHPDADSLSAFAEGLLPSHERVQCLAHLAECSRCREIVFLAQEVPVAPAAPKPLSRRPWWTGRPAAYLAATAAACVAIFGIWMYLRSRTEQAPTRDVMANRPTAPAEKERPRVAENTIPFAQPRRAKSKPQPARPLSETPRTVSRPSAPPPVEVATAPKNPPASASAAASASASSLSQSAPVPTVQVESGLAGILTGVSGTIVDSSGAVIPRVAIQLRNLATSGTANANTDEAGQFKFTGLAAGSYDLRITAPGFRQISTRVEVREHEMASLRSELPVGSVSESIEVAAAAPALQTSSASISTVRRHSKPAAPREPRPLPSKLPASITVARGKTLLTVDSEGALFFSGNAGRSWKAIKPQWSGKVIGLAERPEQPPSKERFQLTTESGSLWLSRDGRRWYVAARN